MKTNHHYRSTGFSLIELMTVIFIIGIIISITLPSFARLSGSVGVHSSSKTIVTMLRAARQLAASRNAIYIIDFDKDKRSVSIVDENGHQEMKSHILPEWVYFHNDPGKLDDIQFFPSGRAIKHDGGAAINSVWITSKKDPLTGDRITVLPRTGRVLLRKDQDTP